MSLQRSRDRTPGYEHLDGCMQAGQTPHVQQALAFMSGAGSMSVSEISFGLQFPSPTSSFISCCIVATAAQGYFLQVGQLWCLRDCRELSFPWDRPRGEKRKKEDKSR